jgi:hypothetical protein
MSDGLNLFTTSMGELAKEGDLSCMVEGIYSGTAMGLKNFTNFLSDGIHDFSNLENLNDEGEFFKILCFGLIQNLASIKGLIGGLKKEMGRDYVLFVATNLAAADAIKMGVVDEGDLDDLRRVIAFLSPETVRAILRPAEFEKNATEGENAVPLPKEIIEGFRAYFDSKGGDASQGDL